MPFSFYSQISPFIFSPFRFLTARLTPAVSKDNQGVWRKLWDRAECYCNTGSSLLLVNLMQQVLYHAQRTMTPVYQFIPGTSTSKIPKLALTTWHMWVCIVDLTGEKMKSLLRPRRKTYNAKIIFSILFIQIFIFYICVYFLTLSLMDDGGQKWHWEGTGGNCHKTG